MYDRLIWSGDPLFSEFKEHHTLFSKHILDEGMFYRIEVINFYSKSFFFKYILEGYK